MKHSISSSNTSGGSGGRVRCSISYTSCLDVLTECAGKMGVSFDFSTAVDILTVMAVFVTVIVAASVTAIVVGLSL